MPQVSYIQNSETDRQAMLKAIGVETIEDLFACIPPEARAPEQLDIPLSMTEMELSMLASDLSGKNRSASSSPCFLGAGIYDHYVPAVIDFLASRSEFYTAYTPYQAEASQGTLQAIFEYQTMIVGLTGLDVSNASLYDGASAVAEAASLAMQSKRKKKIVVARSMNPEYRQVLQSYLDSYGGECVACPVVDGTTDIAATEALLEKDVAALIIQHPNFFGSLEEVAELSRIAKEKGVLFVISVDPISLGVLQSPGHYGADIAIGEGQGLGNPMYAGGSTFGFMAVTESLLRKLPGRLVGETLDRDGRRGFCLTLQAREQHIRRDKASSNICTNQGVLALRGAIYLAAVGKQGLKRVAESCTVKAHELAEKIEALNGYSVPFKTFFKEFAVQCPVSPKEIEQAMTDANLLGGYNLSRYYPELENHILVAVTEKRTEAEMKRFVEVLKKFAK